MIGIPLISITIICTFVLFALSKIGQNNNDNIYILLSQISGLVGSILISWNFILATRTKIIENTFNGLDKVYKVHNIIGQIAFILLINHPILLIINSLPFNSTKLYLVPNLNNIPYLFGILGVYALIILVTLTLFVDIPYKYWKRIHEYMGLVIILGSIHSLLIVSDTSRYLPLKAWVLAWNSLAILAYFYKRVIYYLIRSKHNYKVYEVVQEKNYLMITLESVNPFKSLKFRAGQFAFFSLSKWSGEEHPFSILEQNESKIKIGTKIIGNFTLQMSNLKVGDLVSVNGPFGVFGDSVKKAKKSVWISGGIGITPFLSLISALNGKFVTMIHTSHSSDSTIFVNIFKNYSYYFPNFKFVHHLSDQLGRLNNTIIKNYVDLSPDTYVFLCGPNVMMESLCNELPKCGIRKKRIIFEDFALK